MTNALFSAAEPKSRCFSFPVVAHSCPLVDARMVSLGVLLVNACSSVSPWCILALFERDADLRVFGDLQEYNSSRRELQLSKQAPT